MNNKNEFKPENGDIHKARGKKSIECRIEQRDKA